MTDEKRTPEQAFNAALTAAQSEWPKIGKDARGHGYNYMSLPQLLAGVLPVIGRHGLSVRWEGYTPEGCDPGDAIGVRCVLSHVDGHSVSSAFEAPPAAPNPKRKEPPAQLLGAAQTYACRYTLQTVLGFCAEIDLDGETPDAKPEPKPKPSARVHGRGPAPNPPAHRPAPSRKAPEDPF